MSMNKQAGNMYNWTSHTWNPIRGECPHDCKYCYMKGFKVGKLRLEEKELKTRLGKGNTIFVGSSVDMFAERVSGSWIKLVLRYCMQFDENTYLFQSKNPRRFKKFLALFPTNTILGTTIETNRDNDLSKAPSVSDRVASMTELRSPKMVSIEPVLDFDRTVMLRWIQAINPKFVSIGADSKNHNLPEPSKDKLLELIEQMEKFTEVKVKSNLDRILKGE